jgi:hypothetical protein
MRFSSNLSFKQKCNKLGVLKKYCIIPYELLNVGKKMEDILQVLTVASMKFRVFWDVVALKLTTF